MKTALSRYRNLNEPEKGGAVEPGSLRIVYVMRVTPRVILKQKYMILICNILNILSTKLP